jgi:hypothetical protein
MDMKSSASRTVVVQDRNAREAINQWATNENQAEFYERKDLEKRRLAVEARTDNFFDVLADHRKNIHSWLTENEAQQQQQQQQQQLMFGGQGQRLKFLNVQENPHSKPGRPLYNRFVAAWARVADQTVVLGFHGTSEENIASICRTGLDPGRRQGQAMGPGEYFATNA